VSVTNVQKGGHDTPKMLGDKRSKGIGESIRVQGAQNEPAHNGKRKSTEGPDKTKEGNRKKNKV
jgi:hypothetical protein